MTGFNKVLVANRGEIACRILRSVREAGYQSVAVYSEADALAPHVQEADEAVCIGPAQVGESYLNVDKILWACQVSGADALHPGYGFLSENAGFAKACADADVTFIGPPASAIELMGSKRHSKVAMLKAGVPCIEGYEGGAQDAESLEAEAARIGVPLMVKASAGGGGRGMRLVTDLSVLGEELNRARSEAEKAFGDGELILERAVLQPRHVEIQVFADAHGNCVYLGERDCSIQRRHQKVVEEAPSPFVDSGLREKMGEAAVKAATSCGYVGAGTVEFLVDEERNFYFLEMNTRLQVEHPVTELITGVDLVDWQLRVAAGERLPLSQDDITYEGHAIEVRLYAEDPSAEFMPQTGMIHQWSFPSGPGLRVDAGITSGAMVSPHYDPMLAKLIAWGRDRSEALRRVRRLVSETVLLGVRTNKTFLLEALGHSVFERGEATTAFVQECIPNQRRLELARPSAELMVLGAGLQYLQDSLGVESFAPTMWCNTEGNSTSLRFRIGEDECSLSLVAKPLACGFEFSARIDEEDVAVRIDEVSASSCRFTVNHVTKSLKYFSCGSEIFVDAGEQSFVMEDLSRSPAVVDDGSGSGRLVASTDGAVVAVEVEVGQKVEKGQTLVVIEAMKMEHPIRADVTGSVTELLVAQGNQVKTRQHLLTVEPSES